MKLLIVESPTKAKTLSRFLGDGYSVEATKGHIKDLPKSKLGVDVEHNFQPDFIEVPKQKETIAKLRKLATGAGEIYLATDPDREGEAISQHVLEIISDGKKTKKKFVVKRIVFHEITKHAVEEAIDNPREVDENLVSAQIARRVLDRLVGYNLSPLLWRKVRRGLSAGRVQSATLRLIVEREREIEAFKAVEYWEILVDLQAKTTKAKQFTVSLTKIDGKKAEVHNKKESDKVVSDLEKEEYQVQDVKKREVKKHAYPPFTTSTMSQAGSRVFGWGARKTMSIAQSLYEQGLITYHRTDSTNIAAQAISGVREYIEKEFGQKYLPEQANLYKTNSKVAQEAHEAIRPTNFEKNQELEGDEKKLLDLIWKRFVACQMANAVYDETAVIVKAGIYELRVSGRIMKFDGFRKVYGGVADKEDQVQELPNVVKGEELNFIKVNPTQKFTEPPPRYNEASLIKTLEKLGIGRPSTYAPTISTIQVRSYVEKEEGKFYPTPVGIAVNDFLVKNFSDIVDYSFTAEMEDDLDHIANGKKDWHVIMKAFWGPFHKKTEDVGKNAERVKIETEKLNKPCPECAQALLDGDKTRTGELVIRVGRFGKFISCSLFPECKYTEKFLEKIGMKCPECKTGEVILKKSKKGKFYGCSNYPECKFASWKKPGV